MKVLLINGSPHKDGCTKRALIEISNTLNEEGIDTEIIEILNSDIRGCIDCKTCFTNKKCIFDDLVNEVSEKFREADGLVIGSPVYYASPNGTVISFLDRLFRVSSSFDKSMKVGAAFTSARRAGNTATFDVLNKYFTISEMPIVSSRYWNNTFGYTKEDVEKDKEGLSVARQLGINMAYLIKAINLYKEKYGMPQKVDKARTDFFD